MSTNVANAFDHRSVIHQIARAQRRSGFGVRFVELHSADQSCGCEKRERVDEKDSIAS